VLETGDVAESRIVLVGAEEMVDGDFFVSLIDREEGAVLMADLHAEESVALDFAEQLGRAGVGDEAHAVAGLGMFLVYLEDGRESD
jgi:hypothetical protein